MKGKHIMQINQHVTIKVAEPWDFFESKGNNIFSGIVIGYTDSVKKGAFLIKSEQPFVLNGIRVNYVVAMYRSKNADCKNLNLAYIADDLVNRFQELNSIESELKFIMIGSLD